MANLTRRSRLFQFVLLTMMLNGCAAAVDEDGAATASEESTDSSSEALKGVTATKGDVELDANAADCDAAPAKGAAQTDPYQEYMSIMETANQSVDAAAAGNPCRAACRCCAWGNRFCCSHCRWCSGPIGPYGATGEVLAK